MKIEKLWEAVRGLDNVTGYSQKLRLRVRDGKMVEEETFRVYVADKLPLKELRLGRRVPPEIEGIPTDVWQIGPMVIPPLMGLSSLAYTQRERPLVAGISIGNEAITAGTHGWYFEQNGEIGIGSNAHVIAEDPLKAGSPERDILQPGRYDGGKVPDDKVATYKWHQQLYGGMSACPLGQGATWLGNKISDLVGARTKFKTITEGENKIDFGVTYEPVVDYKLELHRAKEWAGMIGLGFAGSDQASFFCKVGNILATGWRPTDVDIYEPQVEDVVHKIGRTTEYNNGKVLDDCAHGTVNYGGLNYIEFDDLIMTEPMLQGGDSGDSGWRKLMI